MIEFVSATLKNVPVVYSLKSSELESGDIILETSESTKSSLIRFFDRGHFSHAIIVLDEWFSLEAVGSGVRLVPTRSIVVHDQNNVSILRPITPLNGEKLRVDALKYLFAPYSLVGAMLALLPFPSRSSNKKFCSELVAKLYSEQGMRLAALSPSKITPGRIERDIDNLLKLNTDNIIIKRAISNKLSMRYIQSYLTRNYAFKMSNQNLQENIERKACEKFGQAVQVQLSTSSNPITFPREIKQA